MHKGAGYGQASPELTEELVGAVVAWACNSCSLVAERESGLGGKREEGEAFMQAWLLAGLLQPSTHNQENLIMAERR